MKKSKKMIGMLLLICVAMLLPVPANAASKELRESLTVKHREIIDLYASKGYRYAGMIPIELGNPTHIRKLDLIFEKDEQE